MLLKGNSIDKSKVQKIKKDLIRKAKLKRSYAKLKEREPPTTTAPNVYARADPAPNLEPHPERQARLDNLETASVQIETETREQPLIKARHRKPKPIPFQKEAREAEERRVQAEERRKAIEKANRERQKKTEERERFRKAMAKARTGGRNGQRKLGRESQVLLERVKRVMAE